jgi:hypothetical protein
MPTNSARTGSGLAFAVVADDGAIEDPAEVEGDAIQAGELLPGGVDVIYIMALKESSYISLAGGAL